MLDASTARHGISENRIIQSRLVDDECLDVDDTVAGRYPFGVEKPLMRLPDTVESVLPRATSRIGAGE
jgi:hypothetical protein